MRKASMVLGIVGGALSLLGALSMIILGAFMNSDQGFFSGILNRVYSDFFNISGDFWGILFLVIGVAELVCGVLGLIGGLKVNKNNVTAGVLMIVSAGISLLMSAWLSMILFALGGIFALIKEKPPVTPMQLPVE